MVSVTFRVGVIRRGCQETPERFSCPVEPSLDSRFRDGKKVGDMEKRPVLAVMKIQNLVVLARKLLQRLPDFSLREILLPALHRVGAVHLVNLPVGKPFKSGVLRRLTAPLFLSDTPGPVPRDGIQPPRELRRVLQVRQRLKGGDENILGDVLGGRFAAEGLPGNKLHGPSVTLCQSIKRRKVSQERRDNQSRIVCRRIKRCLLVFEGPNAAQDFRSLRSSTE
jgi:hypothetical protein